MLATRDIKLVWIFGILKRVVWGMTLLPFWRLGSFSCHLLEKAGSWTYSKTCLIYVAVQKWRLTKKPKSWNFRAIFAGTHSPGKTGEVWDSKWSTSSDYIDATRAHMLSGRKVEIRALLTLIQNGNNCHTNWSFWTQFFWKNWPAAAKRNQLTKLGKFSGYQDWNMGIWMHGIQNKIKNDMS